MNKKWIPRLIIWSLVAIFVTHFYILPLLKLKTIQYEEEESVRAAKNPPPSIVKIPEKPKSQEYLTGSDWAKMNTPTKASQCQGSVEFMQGCREYFAKHLKPVRQSKYEGMTTTECKEEVHSEKEFIAQWQNSSKRNPLGTGVYLNADLANPDDLAWELEKCENYDKFADNKFMTEAYTNLQTLIEKLKASEALTEEEKTQVLKDVSRMSKIRDQPYKTAYLTLSDEYFKRLSGEFKEPVIEYPKISCKEYQDKIDELQRIKDERDADEKDAYKQINTRDLNALAVHSNELNQQRAKWLGEWMLYTKGAEAAGCNLNN